jgi:aminoglycoside phosphotransferase (APT) family kinase protein
LDVLGGAHGDARVPHPVALKESIVVQDHLVGEPYPRADVGAARRVGGALAALRHSPALLAEARSRARLLAEAEAIATQLPALDRRLARHALVRARSLFATIVERRPVVTHGDLGWAQLLLTPSGHVVFLDWDKAAMADAGLDIGNLLAQAARFDVASAWDVGTAILRGYGADNELRTESLAYALLVGVRKMAWVNEASRPALREAVRALRGGGPELLSVR